MEARNVMTMPEPEPISTHNEGLKLQKLTAESPKTSRAFSLLSNKHLFREHLIGGSYLLQVRRRTDSLLVLNEICLV